jgi:hypothetical protein
VSSGRGRAQRKDEGGQVMWKYLVFMYVKTIVKAVEIALRRGEEDKGQRMRNCI